MLIEWRFFSFVIYVKSIYYVVVDFMRENLIMRSGEEKL